MMARQLSPRGKSQIACLDMHQVVSGIHFISLTSLGQLTCLFNCQAILVISTLSIHYSFTLSL